MGHNFAMGHDGTKVLLSKFGFFNYYRVIAQSFYFHGNVHRLLKDPFVTNMLCVAVYVCMFVCLCVYVQICMYVCMNVCMYVYTHVCMYVCMCVCAYVYMYVCIYLYIFSR